MSKLISGRLYVKDDYYLCDVDQDQEIMYIADKQQVGLNANENTYGVFVPNSCSKGKAILLKEEKNGIIFYRNWTDLLKAGSFIPFIDENYKLETGLSMEVWNLFVKHGVVQEKIVGRMLLCPESLGLPTVYPGCPECGDPFTKPDQLVHHYKCGNVDFLHNFIINRERGSLTCMKCHEAELIINADYDVSVGLHRCQSCGWTGDGPKMIGKCMATGTMFRMTEAYDFTVKEYTFKE